MTQSKHTPGLNAPCYSNPEGVTHKFEKDVNGKMLAVMRTYSMKAARTATAAPELLEALEAILARLNGEYDHPSLVKFGPLDINGDADVTALAEAAIAKAGV